jgi:putative flippase GtrA
MPESQTLIESPHVTEPPRGQPASTLRPLLDHPESRRVVKYGIVGVINVAIDFLLYAVLVSLGVWYAAAKTLSLVVATLFGYTFNRLWTFRAGRHKPVLLGKYVTAQVVCLVVNLALLTLLVHPLHQDEITAQAIALPFVAALSFLVNRLWTFGPRHRHRR